MTAWLRLAALGFALALPPPPAWVPLTQAPAADQALLRARQPELRRLFDSYNYSAPDAPWQITELAAPTLEQHLAFQYRMPGAALIVVLARKGTEAVLFPLLQGGVAQPHPTDNLHNLAAFNSLLSSEPAPPAGAAGDVARAQFYLACTGVEPPLPAAVELPAPRQGLIPIEVRPWEFTFDSHGLLVGFRRLPFAAGGGD